MLNDIAPAQRPSAHRVTFARVARSEWMKFRTQASPQILFLLSALAVVLMGVASAAGASSTRGYTDDQLPQLAELTIMNAVNVSLTAVAAPVAVAAALLANAEFGRRLAALTFLAVPRRYPVFFARAALLFVVALAVGAVSTVACCLAISPIMAAGGHELRFWSPTVVLPLLGSILSLGLFAVLGCCIGTLCRSTIGGIFTVIAAVQIAPMLFVLLETNFGLSVFASLQWALPSVATLAGLHSYAHPEFPLPPLGPPLAVGLAVFAAWIFGTGAFACLRLQRDV